MDTVGLKQVYRSILTHAHRIRWLFEDWIPNMHAHIIFFCRACALLFANIFGQVVLSSVLFSSLFA